jgi:hypothetical protein
VRALGALLLAGLIAALAFAPSASVLELTDGQARVLVPLDEGASYSYSYLNSVYNAPVDERHYRSSNKLHITRVVSPDIRAVEYFRWNGEPRPTGAVYEQEAPPNDQAQLLIRVTPQYRQRLAGAGWEVDLAETFGEGLVRVVPARLPLLAAFFLRAFP